MRLQDPKENGWRLLFALGEWECWHVPNIGKVGWRHLCIRRLNARAPRRSYWLSWHPELRRLSRGYGAAILAQDSEAIMKQLLLRLHQWK
jgi:hypothetical protein